jgi:hypothetical protein
VTITPTSVPFSLSASFRFYFLFDCLHKKADFGYFLMVAARSIILAIIFPAAMSSIMEIRTLDSPATSSKLFGYFALIYWC